MCFVIFLNDLLKKINSTSIPTTSSTNSPEKILAERINGWAAMMGFWAAIGAYLTTGQIIPGVV